MTWPHSDRLITQDHCQLGPWLHRRVRGEEVWNRQLLRVSGRAAESSCSAAGEGMCCRMVSWKDGGTDTSGQWAVRWWRADGRGDAACSPRADLQKSSTLKPAAVPLARRRQSEWPCRCMQADWSGGKRDLFLGHWRLFQLEAEIDKHLVCVQSCCSSQSFNFILEKEAAGTRWNPQSQRQTEKNTTRVSILQPPKLLFVAISLYFGGTAALSIGFLAAWMMKPNSAGYQSDETVLMRPLTAGSFTFLLRIASRHVSERTQLIRKRENSGLQTLIIMSKGPWETVSSKKTKHNNIPMTLSRRAQMWKRPNVLKRSSFLQNEGITPKCLTGK